MCPFEDQINLPAQNGRKGEIMKAIIRGAAIHQTRYVLIFIIILLQSCASTSGVRLEGNDFEENLPGLWKGKWNIGAAQGNQHINISKVEGNEVHLTGLMEGGGVDPDTDKVFGRIKDSTLLLTWPDAGDNGCKEKYVLRRDDSNKLILDGKFSCGTYNGDVSLNKSE